MKRRKTGLLTALLAAVTLLFLVLPILIIFPLAFGSSEYLRFPPPGWTLRWMREILGSPEWVSSMLLSLRIAVMASVLAVCLGLATSFALVRGDFPLKRVIYAVILLPMIVPNIISAIAMFFFFSEIPTLPSTLSIVIGHTVLSIPITVIILASTLQGVDPQLENAALSMGADRLTAFRHVTLPLAVPGVVSAAIFAFLNSFDELLVAMFLAGTQTQTLPVRIWNSVMFQISPAIAAVSVLLIVVSVACLLAANFASARARARS